MLIGDELFDNEINWSNRKQCNILFKTDYVAPLLSMHTESIRNEILNGFSDYEIWNKNMPAHNEWLLK